MSGFTTSVTLKEMINKFPMRKRRRNVKKKKKIMVKVASITGIIKGLKPRQQKTMKAHARHHSLKHMRSMARAMKRGATFASAHTRAMRSVGK